jgi:glutamate dehydrogenase
MDGSGARPLTLDVLAQAFARELGRPGPTELDRLEHAFLEQALEDYVDDETPDLSPADFAAALADFWRFGEQRAAGSPPLIRLRAGQGAQGRPLAYDFLEIIQDDRPFLVDSVMGELAEAGALVKAMYHPIVRLEREDRGLRKVQGDRHCESMILVVLEPLGEDRREPLLKAVDEVLADVRAAVDDHGAMQALMERAISELEKGPAGFDKGLLAEEIDFLRWMKGEHFVFLGAREYTYPRTPDGGYAAEAPLSQDEAGLGLLREPDRAVLRRASEPAVLTHQMKRQLDLGDPVTVAKANLRSRVHRRVVMDYVGVKRYGADGRPSGELRFVGLFTAEAYDKTTRDVPLIRRKVADVLRRAGKTPDSHNEKRLRNILETYPRDELFQVSEDELLKTSLAVMHLYDRPRVRLFARRDPFDRFVSVLFYVPRDRFHGRLREHVGRMLAEAWGGRVSAWYPQFTDAPLARVHFIIGLDAGNTAKPDIPRLEAEIEELSRTWPDRLEAAARRSGLAPAAIQPMMARWGEAFPAGYRDRTSLEGALLDVQEIEAFDADAPVRVRAFRAKRDNELQFRFKLYHRGEVVPLADVLPILESMGLKAIEEFGDPVSPAGDEQPVWVHEFLLEDPRGANLVFEDVKDPFEQAFVAVWTGLTENDGFNRLVMELGVSWREAALVRALCRYRQQSGLDPSQAVQEEALIQHPEIGRRLLELFRVRFRPEHGGSPEDREKRAQGLFDEITEALQAVASLDHDRVLRRLALLIQAIKRTNYYQDKPYISFKVASRELEDLPLPKPYREIFVWAPHVEGVHLRFGPVARGGLRWSDRRDDFRTEVLGLVKAQQVKNAVIVPVGSKGGFYPKALPRGGAPEAVRAEAVRAYKTFLSGLLDITDNLGAQGQVVRPERVIALEADDPYLVVAADKGTATFSDIANGVSADYGFWLGDAFASGGSAGYDHKAMGITARGAWEAVKRHFREIGKDIQSEPFTVLGVGDMSGDVFGNGMLLSRQIRLVAAFDHRDVFLDPNPDPEVSYRERERLFALPRSSWQDYDKSLISEGGGVFSRQAKSIPLSPQVQALLGVTDAALAPTDLIRAILKAEAELLYFGGIGTYVKAPHETDVQVGDKANDALRVDATELRAQVVGEGANLGLTQAARIAYARAGGRINTDAIDNSAGVDTSDHEVNIKILTGALEAKGQLDRESRDRLLASMTDDVAAHVLAHNYDQTLALTLQEATAATDIDEHQGFMKRLEAAGRLDRRVEGLPTGAQLDELRSAKRGLTRPELAVLTAYGKLELFDETVASHAPDDPFFEATLVGYFPEALRRYEAEMKGHRLRREIVSTVLANEIVNMAGPTFPSRLRSSTGVDAAGFVTAFEAARRSLRLDEAWDAVSAADLKAPAAVQTALYQEIALVQRRQTYRLARKLATATGKSRPGVAELIDAYRPTADVLRDGGSGLLSPFEKAAAQLRAERLIEQGAPADLAKAVTLLRPMIATVDIADLSNGTGWPIAAAARMWSHVGAAFDLDRLRAAAGGLAVSDPYERQAVRRLIEDLLAQQADLTRQVASSADASAGEDAKGAEAAVRKWVGARKAGVRQLRETVEEIERAGQGWSFAKLTLANAALRELTAG